jgi:large subunit ribosomal protein L10
MQGYETKVNDSKVGAVDALKDQFGRGSDFIFTDYRGLTVDQITRLRQTLRENGAEFKVVKNNYAKIAFQQMEKPDVSDYLVGPTAVAIAAGDSAPVVKVLFDFAKESPVAVKGALVGTAIFDAAEAEAYSKLPGRDALYSQLMSVMQAPLQNLVYAMNGVPTQITRVMQAVADQKAAS